jgi:two-component system NtrC family sensor kinase
VDTVKGPANSKLPWRFLFDSINDAIFLHSLTPEGLPGLFQEVNEVACRRWGYTREELLRMTPAEIEVPDKKQELPAILRRLEKNGQVVYEMVHRARDGRRIPVEISAHRVEVEGQSLVLSIARDLTERRRSEMELRRIQAAIDDVSEAILMTDLKGRPLYLNLAFASLSGHIRETLPPTGVAPLFVDSTLFKTIVDRICEGFPWHGESELRTLSGDVRPVQMGVTAIEDDRLRRVGLSFVLRDMTERRRIEREREALQAQLLQAQKMESIGRLSAGVAHEINSPIQYVGDNTRFLKDAFADLMGMLKTLEAVSEQVEKGLPAADCTAAVKKAIADCDWYYLSREIPKAIDQSLEGIQRVSQIVLAMKEFSHPDSVGRVPSDLNRGVESTISVARNEWRYVAEVETDLDAHLPLVTCAPGEINQVLLNLIVNAAHAVDLARESGQIIGKGRIRVITRRMNDEVEIQVIDNGTGISEAIRSRIFEPFFTTKKTGQGTGQGLALSYNIVKKHGGSLTVESREGEGTTFFVRLPLQGGGV